MNALIQKNYAHQTRVLIAEDEPAHAEAIQRALANAGWTNTDIVNSLAAYRRHVAESPPDIALLDLVLPDGRSTELLSAPADEGEFPIVVMTSHGDEKTAIEVIKAGAFDYVIKSPGSLTQLPNTLSRIQREWSLVRERKLAVDALRVSEARYRVITENSPTGIYMADENGLIVYVNPAIATQFGVAASVLLETGWSRFIHPLDAARVTAAWTEYIAQGLPQFEIECRIIAGDGAGRHLQASVTPVREGDRICGHVGTTRDITERNSLQRQLVQAQKMEAIGQLTGGIAHDFNNILTSLLGYTELALDLYVPDKTSKLATYLQEVQKAGERAKNLTSKLLDFGRGKQGEAEVFAVGPVIAEVLQLLKATFSASIKIVPNISSTAPLVMLDPNHLHQMLMNLCINARDAIDSSGQIDVGLRRRVGVDTICGSCQLPIKGEFVEISVRDSGTGIAPSALPHIFEPFFTTKQFGKGSGMGLSTVHGLVHGAKGHLLVESEAGVGTTIRLLFPAASAASTASVVPLPFVASPKPATSGKNRKPILVVDDEPAIGNLLGELLRSQGYTATTFVDSVAALAEFKSNPTRYGAILTDFSMPDLNGIELARAIWSEFPGFPIILCTGYTDKTGSAEKEPGIRAVFIKPVKAVRLIAAIDEIFDSAPDSLRQNP